MNANTVLRWGIIVGVLAILFVPLYVANNLYFPFITGKNFAFRVLVELVVAAWLVLALKDPSVRPKKSALLYALGAFLIALGISAIIGANPDKSFWSNFERMEGWVGIAHLAAYFVVLFSVFHTDKLWKYFWNTAIVVSVIEACYGGLQLLHVFAINQGGVRVDGTFGNATYLAVYMLFSFFMTVLAIVWWGRGKNGSRFLAYCYGAVLVLELLMIFYTATRGAIIGLVGGLLIAGIIFLLSEKENRQLRRLGLIAVAVIAVAFGGFLLVRNTTFVQNNEVLSRLAGVATPQGLIRELSTRAAIWDMAWKGFQERPLFGWGQEGFNYVFNKYYQPTLYAQESWFDRAHNEFLDWLVATGAVGFILYLSFFGIALWYQWRKGNPFSGIERGLFTGLLAAYAINNLVVFDNLFSYIYFFTILAYIAYRAESQGSDVTAETTPWRSPVSVQTYTVAAPLIVIGMIVVFYFVNVPGYATASDIIQGLSQHSEGVATNFDYFQKAVASAGGGGLGLQETREQLVQFALQVKSLNAGDAQFQTSVQNYTVQQMDAQVAATPNDARIRILYGQYLLQIGDLNDARVQLLAAQKLSPQKQAIMFELGDLELTAGNSDVALKWLKEAYDAAPTYDAARSIYASVAIRTGNRALASSLLLPRYGTMTPDDDTILAAYVAVKDFQSVLAILHTRAEKDPNNYQKYVDLAAGYYQSGDGAGAIAALQKAIALNPSFASQGQSLISQIQSGTLK